MHHAASECYLALIIDISNKAYDWFEYVTEPHYYRDTQKEGLENRRSHLS